MGQRVLVTGHRGYIGSVLVPHLLAAGHEVVGLDTGYFDACTLGADTAAVPEIRKDIRDVEPGDLVGFDAVIHLAALSNDPIGNLDETWTDEINHRSSVRLAELAREAGVRRFVFSSSCIMYGMATAEVVDETSPLDPKTTYARSKVQSELAIAEMADDRFSPTFLRNGTVYGYSPRMRFDTVLNDFVGAAFTTGTVTVLSDGKPWRPVVHVDDVARSFVMVLDAPLDLVHNQAFNNGADHLNWRIGDLAEAAAAAVPGCRVDLRGEPGADQRTYRADFSKFARTFPDFSFRWDPASGARQLVSAFRDLNLTRSDYTDRRFVRLAWLTHLIGSGALDGRLRWRAAVGGGVR
jgi:nucleoside-diphosphate-sugar epimerase